MSSSKQRSTPIPPLHCITDYSGKEDVYTKGQLERSRTERDAVMEILDDVRSPLIRDGPERYKNVEKNKKKIEDPVKDVLDEVRGPLYRGRSPLRERGEPTEYGPPKKKRVRVTKAKLRGTDILTLKQERLKEKEGIKGSKKKKRARGKVLEGSTSGTNLVKVSEISRTTKISPTTGETIVKVLSHKKKLMPRSEVEAFQCQDCKLYFTNQRDLDVHIKFRKDCKLTIKDQYKSVFGDGFVSDVIRMDLPKLPYICIFCQKSHTAQQDLTDHCKQNHAEESKDIINCPAKLQGKIPCSLCQYLVARFSMQRHLWTAHGISTKRKEVLLKCQACGYNAWCATSYHKHIASCLNTQPFVCEVCGKRFNNKYSMKDHMNTHTGDRPYPCPYCHKAFRGKNGLRRHKFLHMNFKPYECGLCGKDFVQLTSINLHMSKYHSEIPKEKYKEARILRKTPDEESAVANAPSSGKLQDDNHTSSKGKPPKFRAKKETETKEAGGRAETRATEVAASSCRYIAPPEPQAELSNDAIGSLKISETKTLAPSSNLACTLPDIAASTTPPVTLHSITSLNSQTTCGSSPNVTYSNSRQYQPQQHQEPPQQQQLDLSLRGQQQQQQQQQEQQQQHHQKEHEQQSTSQVQPFYSPPRGPDAPIGSTNEGPRGKYVWYMDQWVFVSEAGGKYVWDSACNQWVLK